MQALSASMMDPSEMEKEEELKKKKKEEEKRGKIGEGVSPQFTRLGLLSIRLDLDISIRLDSGRRRSLSPADATLLHLVRLSPISI